MSSILRGAMTRIVSTVHSNIMQKAFLDVQSSVAISLHEKIAVGVEMSFALYAGPVYILTQILKYRERN